MITVSQLTPFLNAKVIAVDTETTGTNAYRGDKVVGVSLYTEYGDNSYSVYVPIAHNTGNVDEGTQSKLWEVLSQKDVQWLAWNAKFDVHMLRVSTPADFTSMSVLDVMLAFHLLNENEPSFALKTLATKYLSSDSADEKYNLEKVLIENGLRINEMGKLDPKLVAPYAEQDTKLTWDMWNFCVPYLKAHNLYQLWHDVSYYQMVLANMEQHGLLLNVNSINQELVRCEDGQKQAIQEIYNLTGRIINPNSVKQVKAITGIEGSTSIDVLETLDSPEAKQIVLYRQWTKTAGTYYRPFLENIGNDGRLHPNFWISGTVTGRLSCRNPNLQAIPRKDADAEESYTPKSWVKSVFESQEGYSIVQFDYKQAEVYIGTHLANAINMRSMLVSGSDIHQATADMIGVPRFVAKTINFSMQYGIGATALAESLKVSVPKAREYLELYNKAHPEFKQLYNEMCARATRDGYIRLFTGRRRRYDTINSQYTEYHKASSHLIQGTVAEVIRIVMMELYSKLPQAQQILQVHDSIIFELEDSSIQELVPQISDIMTSTVTEFSIPLKVDVEYGKNWSKLSKWRA